MDRTTSKGVETAMSPEPESGGIRVKVQATGACLTDTMTRAGPTARLISDPAAADITADITPAATFLYPFLHVPARVGRGEKVFPLGP